MSKKRIYQTSDGDWTTVSSTERTANLTNWSDERDDLTLDLQSEHQKKQFASIREKAIEFRVNEIVAYLTEARFDLDKLGTYDNREEWLEAFAMLKQMASDGHNFGVPPNSSTQPGNAEPTDLIPQTRLRRFYQTLRIFGGIGITTQIVEYLREERRSAHLSKIIDESVRHFRRYENSGERFHERLANRPHKVDKYLNERSQFAKCLQARLRLTRKNDQTLVASDDTQLGYVDYEISPFRRSGAAVMEDNQIGVSGAGGLDLLLVDRTKKSPVPVIGEIKAKTDRDLFLALIQSLVYAVELGSPSQLERLKEVYGNHFDNLSNDSKLDIHLLFQEEGQPVKLYEQTLDFADQLFSYGGEMCNFVKSIKFVHVKLDTVHVKLDTADRTPDVETAGVTFDVRDVVKP